MSIMQRQTGKEHEFEKMIQEFTDCAHESSECLIYSFFKSFSEPGGYIVFYKFTSKKAQDEHIANLAKKIGPAKSKGELLEKFFELIITPRQDRRGMLRKIIIFRYNVPVAETTGYLP